MTYVVYLLRDPKTRRVRYVGATKRPCERSASHRTKHKQPGSQVQKWTNLLSDNGESPIFEIVASFGGTEINTPGGKLFDVGKCARMFEDALITALRNSGCNLLNADMDEVRRHAKK